MNADAVIGATVVICGTILIILCVGSPDLLDAIIQRAMTCR